MPETEPRKIYRLTKFGPARTNKGVVIRFRESDVTEAINYAKNNPGYGVEVEEALMPQFKMVYTSADPTSI